MGDHKVFPGTGGWGLPPFRTLASPFVCYFSEERTFTRDPGKLENQLQNLEIQKGLQILHALGEALGISEHSKWGTDVR